jgi:dTDP-4-dehydrorhamnose 3,5-epimerase
MPQNLPKQDVSTVTPSSESKRKLIHGVFVHRMPLHEDERGELMEIFNPAWGISEHPLCYAYFVSIRPRHVKGWVVHKLQDDRLFFSRGTMRVALYDSREDSPTYKQVDVMVLGERSRGLLTIPAGVFHAVQNIGLDEANFINLPSRAYDHLNPDKYRLSLINEEIPFRFQDLPQE